MTTRPSKISKSTIQLKKIELCNTFSKLCNAGSVIASNFES